MDQSTSAMSVLGNNPMHSSGKSRRVGCLVASICMLTLHAWAGECLRHNRLCSRERSQNKGAKPSEDQHQRTSIQRTSSITPALSVTYTRAQVAGDLNVVVVGWEHHDGRSKFGNGLEWECLHISGWANTDFGSSFKSIHLLCKGHFSGRREYKFGDRPVHGAGASGRPSCRDSGAGVQRTRSRESRGCHGCGDRNERGEQQWCGDHDECPRPHFWGQYHTQTHEWPRNWIYEANDYVSTRRYCGGPSGDDGGEL